MTKATQFAVKVIDMKLAHYKELGWKDFGVELKSGYPEGAKRRVWAIVIWFFVGEGESRMARNLSFCVSKQKPKNVLVFEAVKRLLKRKYARKK